MANIGNPSPHQVADQSPDQSPEQLAHSAAQVLNEAAGIDHHDIALVLGSGWGAAAELLGEPIAQTPANAVPGFHASQVAGHPGTLTTIRVANPSPTVAPTHALILGARTHFYEGKGVRAVAHGVRTAAAAGAKTIILTNGCGSTHPQFAPGTPVLISDHLNLTAASPLEGATFVDLTDLYSARLRALATRIDPTLPQGVYAQFPGPHYETPAEVRMARTLGADLVGMSTALEAIAARAAGLEILGISLVTNFGAGVSAKPLNHAEVLAAGRAAGPRISRLLADIVTRILAEPTPTPPAKPQPQQNPGETA